MDDNIYLAVPLEDYKYAARCAYMYLALEDFITERLAKEDRNAILNEYARYWGSQNFDEHVAKDIAYRDKIKQMQLNEDTTIGVVELFH